MALNVAIQLYRGTLANLAALATTGKAGVLAWTTDTHELYVDAGAGGAGIGTGNAWQKVAQDLVDVNAQTGTTYTILLSDRSKLVTLSNASPIAVTLPQAGANFPSGWVSKIINLGAGLVTITPATSTIDGVATLTLSQYQGITLISDGANYFSVRGKTAASFSDITGTLAQSQLPATIGAGSNLTTFDCGTF